MGSETDIRITPHLSYTESFYKVFPYYLSIGMTYDQYWNEDSTLVIYYREAEELRLEKQNQLAWLQGMYIYDAIGRISPALNPAVKKGVKPQPYIENPYPITDRSKEEVQKQKEKNEAMKAKNFMETFKIKNNQRFKEGSEN